MRLGFHGRVDTVTGSRFLLDLTETRLPVDCGLFQGLKALRKAVKQPDRRQRRRPKPTES